MFLTAQRPVVQEEPPEEDVNINAIKEYVLNPIQAEKEFKVGNFYLKKGSHRAAARRFEEATKWNPAYAEAWLKLGEAREKLGAKKEARAAWTKFLELEPDSKDARDIRKKLNSKK